MATRNLAAEQDSLKALLESPERGGAYIGTPGASVPDMSAAQKQLIQEGINTRTYGSAAGPRDVQGRIAEMQRQVREQSSRGVQGRSSSGVLDGSGRSSTGTGFTDAERYLSNGGTGAGGYGDSALPSTDDVYSRYGLGEAKTKEQMEQEAIDAIQGQLQGIEQRYAGTLAQEAKAGEGRQARGGALSLTSGTLYSPFGETRATEIEEYNRGVVDAINADKQAEINALYAAARGEASESYEAQQGRAMEMANTYINDMTNRYKLGLQEQQMMFDQARSIAEMTGTYGGSPTLEMLKWLEQANQSAADNARADEYLAIAQQQAAAAGRDIIQLGDTYYEYDPAQGFDASAVAIYTKPARATGAAPVEETVQPYGASPYDQIVADLQRGVYTIDELIQIGYPLDAIEVIDERSRELASINTFAGPQRY